MYGVALGFLPSYFSGFTQANIFEKYILTRNVGVGISCIGIGVGP